MEFSGASNCTTWGCGQWHFWNTWPSVTLLFNLSCLQEISWASSSIYISFPGSSRNLKTLPASGLNSSCRVLLTSICEQQTKISRLCDHSSLIIRHLPKTASDFNNCKGQSIHPPTFFFFLMCSSFWDIHNIWVQKLFSFANMVGSFSENRATTVQKGFTVWK